MVDARSSARWPGVLAALAMLLLPLGAAAFDLQGHRGARGLAPENTLAGFEAALAIGVSTLELDTGVSADNVVMVSHDPRLNADVTRGPDGRWLEQQGPTLRSLRADEIAAYDVGQINPESGYAERFPEQQPADGEKIPRLTDVFDLLREQGADEVRLNIETKISPEHPDETASPEDFVDTLLRTIRAAGMSERVTIQSFDWRTLALVNQQAPNIATSCLTAEQRWLDNIRRGHPGPSPWTAGLDIDDEASLPHLVRRAGCRVWSPYHGDLNLATLQLARALGLIVVPWTVNEPSEMRTLIDLGVDGIITDYPDRLRAVMVEKALPLPQPPGAR